MKPYFDLHLHPSLKPYLSNQNAAEKKDCWDILESPFGIFRSQSSLDQMKSGGVNLAITALYAIERPMTSSFLIEQVAPVLTVLDRKMLDFPAFADYLDRVLDEIAHLKKSQSQHGKSFQLLKKMEDYKEDQMNIILALEGGHTLENFGNTPSANLRKLKKENELRFLYLTLVHMTQYPTASHAYGMKLIKTNDQFKPAGFGLTDEGKKLIDTAYDDRIGHRIFCDIKHLSVVSRHQFYEYRKEKGYDQIPILGTHMGIAGISRENRAIAKQFSKRAVRRGDFVEVNYLRPKGIGRGMLNETHFNPWSINLYDEEIPVILDSGGLIGLNLDQRILGAQPVKGEFFGVRELNFILSGYKDPNEKADTVAGEFSDEEDGERELNERKHLRHLCNNILHIVKTGGDRAWQQICIGSDFDGLIDPVNNCVDASEMPRLERDLVAMLPEMMEEDVSYHYDSGNMEEKVRGIMYENGFRFLNTHFN